MSTARRVADLGRDFLAASQFLTRVPIPAVTYQSDSLARAVKFFPVVGLIVGFAAALLHRLLAPHLPRLVAALLVVAFLVLVTGCFHEDGLADAADGFGGGWNRDQILLIFKDSRIGSYGGAALSLSLLARVLLIASLPISRVTVYLIAAHVLCRWSTLPLSYYLPPARAAESGTENAGQGARIARLTTRSSLLVGSLVSFVVAGFALRMQSISAIVAATLVTLLTGIYYRRRIGGVTGDCFGATNQLTEIFVYLTGVWSA